MKPEKPFCSFAEIEDNTSPEAWSVMKGILLCFAQRYHKVEGYAGMGLEATLEELEKMFDDGLIKIGVSDDMFNFYIMLWDAETGNYFIPGEENIN